MKEQILHDNHEASHQLKETFLWLPQIITPYRSNFSMATTRRKVEMLNFQKGMAFL